MKHQALFSLKDNSKKKYSVLSAAILHGALRVKICPSMWWRREEMIAITLSHLCL